MKKSVMFLINGLGIERKDSYSISIEEAMPNLCRLKDNSFFTTAITESVEKIDAYQRFFLGDTYYTEINYIQKYVMKDLKDNPIFSLIKNTNSNKYHIFLEPTNDRVVELVNEFINDLDLEVTKKVYLHLILPQNSSIEYSKINKIVDTIKYHLDPKITVGFIIGKNYFNTLDKKQMDYARGMFFACNCERWRETEKKFFFLEEKGISPCNVEGFCSTNDCFIENNDTILFFNTRREDYDLIYRSIYENMSNYNLPCFSFVRLHTNFSIPYIISNVDYENSLSNMLLRNKKKMLIISDHENINTINFYANGLNSISNPIICFMEKTDQLYYKEYIDKLINDTLYDFILFDYHMDTSSSIYHLKDELKKIDIVLGNIGEVCDNKHSLIITSLYGLHKSLPVADYNNEIVTINYEKQIPIFFIDNSYLKSKYDLFPGETYDILCTALRCITNDSKIYSLVKEKTIVGSIIKSFIK